MRRLARVLLNLATAASVGLAIASGGLWARTWFARDELYRSRDFLSNAIVTNPGTVTLEWFRSPAVGPDHPWQHGSQRYDVPTPRGGSLFILRRAPQSWRMLGFDYRQLPATPASSARPAIETDIEADVPVWALCAAALAVPTVRALRALRRSRRKGANQCPACGYDLRATPDRCPECGRVPATSS